jgi:CheY-like chemotaxis protein
MSKWTDILVIDDEKVINDAVVKICSAGGFSIDSATDAKIALSKFNHTEYRLIVCDIMMPQMDGFQFLSEMNSRKIMTPVIMTTGYSTLENAVNSLYQGAIDFVPKPFTADELLSSVYRGMKYAQLHAMASAKPSKGEIPLFYVPCPSTYYRLGYVSWLSQELAGTVVVGMTDLFLKTVDNIQSLEFEKVDYDVEQGKPCAFIHSAGDLLHHVICPISGKIVEVHDEILNRPDIIEKDPYFNGWIYRVIPSDLDYELKNLIACSSDRL